MNQQTRAIEALDQNKINYKVYEYPTESGPVAAVDVAAYFGYSPDRLFKTMVTSDHKGGYYVFCLPAEKRMDLKKAAAVVGVRNLQMLKPEIFEEMTGYVHGGCSPFGLKTKMPIFVDESPFGQETIYLSGGRVGLLVEVDPQVLKEALEAQAAQFTK